MTDRELLAIFEKYAPQHGNPEDINNAIEALRTRLAQPEPEPFEYWNAVEGWVKIDEVRQHFDTAGCGTIYKTAGEDRVPLYAAPPQREWINLTDEEHMQIAIDCGCLGADWVFYGAAVERKLKEKNAPNL